MIPVREESDFRRQRIIASNLSHYANIIYDDLARLDSAPAALVKQYLAIEWIVRHAQDFRNGRLVFQALRGIQEFAQLGILGFQRPQPEELAFVNEMLLPEIRVFLRYLAILKEFARGIVHRHGHMGQFLQRINYYGENLPDAAEILESAVQCHQEQ